MANERVTERDDGAGKERIVERDQGTTYVDRGGSGLAGVIIGLAVLALVAIVAFFVLNQSRNDNLRTGAITSAASDVANSTSRAANHVGKAADSVGNAASGAQDSGGGQSAPPSQ